jgi:dATP pyrophosphohydrolase
MQAKRPESVLVVVYTRDDSVLLLKRADLPDFWQSVTGAMRWDETDPAQTALRELEEETGIRTTPASLRNLGIAHRFPILPEFRSRYDAEVSHNVEHAFALELAAEIAPTLSSEHTAYRWLPLAQALNAASSWTDRDVINRIGLEHR